MGAPAGTSNDSGGKDTQTPFGTASSTKTKTKFGYTKTKTKTKTKTTNQQNLEDAERMQRENRGGNQPTVKVTETPKVDTSPTQVEVDQSSATDADADDIYTRKKKSKARGRSIMTLTSSQGITDEKLTLGKPSLLGS